MIEKFIGYFSQDKVECFYIDSRRMAITRRQVPMRIFLPLSDPMNIQELYKFIECFGHKEEARFGADNLGITDGYWALKYLWVYSNGEGKFYVTNRYCRKIDWKKLTA